MRITTALKAFSLLLALLPCAVFAAGGGSVFIEDLTWPEVHQRIENGATIAIVPVGGTEQEGPQLATGMHSIVARYAAGEIAVRLGHALVAPVIPYAPSGRIDPPEGSMMFAGTLSLSPSALSAVLEDVARSLRQHGFRLICFVGDSPGSQPVQRQVAEKLSDAWYSAGVRVLHVSDYAARGAQVRWGESMGIRVANPGAHGGHIDTSEMMAVDAPGVRDTMRGLRSEGDYRATGAAGDSSQATAAGGRRYLSIKIEAAVNQIRNAASRTQ